MHFKSLKKELIQKGGFDIERIQKAYTFAEKAHAGQKRKTGEDYVTHPVAVAQKLVHFKADEESIIAALLHDTVEDTEITLETVEKEFGKDVAYLVDGLTKFEKNTFDGYKELDEKIETIRKWMSALEKDLRIAIIKIADRIDNISSLGIFRAEKRIRIAKSTLDIYARVAKWLSLEEVRQELEYYSFPHILNTEQYDELEKRVDKTEKKQISLTKKIQSTFNKKNTKKKTTYKFLPHLTSVQEVYFSPNLPLALYCIVPNEKECYNALSFLHKEWPQKRGSFRDYINTPKINGYKGLHTSIIRDGEQIKVKIMTPEMYEYYLHGVSTFCFDKKKKQTQLPWMEKMKELLQTNKKKSYEFWQGVQSDLLEGFILVYGPKGESISLPQSSTYLDAAFGFLKEKALYVSAIISGGKQIPQRRQIVDGEKIEFHIEKKPQVQYDWLQDVDNVRSIRVIKDYLRERKQKEKIISGKALLQEQFDAHDLGMVDEVKEQTVLVACQNMEIHSMEELFIKIAEVQILPSEVIARIAPEKTKEMDTKEKSKFSITCEVRKDRMVQFTDITSKRTLSSRIDSQIANKNLFRVKIECRGNHNEKSIIAREIRRHRGMRILSMHEKKSSRLEIFILTGILTLLWGLDPVFASIILDTTAVTPDALATIRLGVVFLSFSVLVGLIQLFSKEPKKKRISPLSLPIATISVLLFGVAISSYYALSNTPPSTYLCILYPWFVLASVLSGITHKEKLTPFLLFPALLLFALSTSIALQDPTWSTDGKWWTITATVLFAGYSILNEFFQKKNKIVMRYSGYQMITSGHAFLFSLILLPFFPWPNLESSEYILSIVFSFIFTGLPYFIFGVLLKKNGVSKVGYGLLGIILVAIMGETLLTEQNLHIQKILPIGIMVLGILLLHFLQEKSFQKNLQEPK